MSREHSGQSKHAIPTSQEMNSTHGHHQMFNTEVINKEIQIMKRNQPEILHLKSTMAEMKNSLEAFNGRFEQMEDRISKSD